MLGGDLGQCDEFIGLGIGARIVDEPGGQAPGAVAHALVDEFLHHRQFLVRRRAVGVAHDFLAHVVVRHLMDDVAADADCLHLLEVGGDVDRPGAAIARHGRRHALHEVV
jgi:hypothetical protein